MRIAIIITVFNRIAKTLACFESLRNSLVNHSDVQIKIFLTDDGSTDGTKEQILASFSHLDIKILPGNGQLYWNGGMNNSWREAIREGGFDGYLWLNNDSIILSNLWDEILAADAYSIETYGKGGIYVGSTYNADKSTLTYGGFNFVNKWTLLDEFLIPNGRFQNCQAAHGNITYVSNNVVESEGVFCDEYIHSGGDHDYSYLAFKHNFPVFILRDYVGICENDHIDESGSDFTKLSFQERKKYLNSPLGYNLKNTLLFQKRCFPYRYIPVLLAGYSKLFFPKVYFRLLKSIRK
ncbi:glycosyltransferase family 2 protein [Sphingobacterium lactis]|uniref:glycosyltransferase family 2 protein n=1 Tax=Sphingobacterium lactis TaxID=797291 RepID=UPI003F80C084